MSFRAHFGSLSAELLALALREVRLCYLDLNAALFSGALALPQFEWTERESLWGAWSPEHRSIALSPKLLTLGWGMLNEVLKHEMAHQYVDEVLILEAEEGAHGRSFRKICKERGIDSRAASDPRGYCRGVFEETGDPLTERRRAVLKRVELLLALAQSENQFEAENAMMTARRLMLRYNIEEGAQGNKDDYAFRHLGEPTGRRMAWQRVLSSILAEHFFVEVIIVPVYRPSDGKQCSVFEICGSWANLEMAAYVFDFLQNTALLLWAQHKNSHGITKDRDKQSYLYGVMKGFDSKLHSEVRKNESEGLVWVGDPELKRYFRARHPRICRVSGQAREENEAFSAGHDAGGRIVLHRGVKAGQSEGLPRQLGGKGAI